MAKKFLFALLFATRLTRLAAWLNRHKVTILCYHSVTRQLETIPDDPHKLHLQIDSFLHHLDYLQAHYRIVSLSEFVKARRENIALPSDLAILTFDDGVRNFLTVVAPILLERKIPATSFIVTGESFTQETSTLGEQWTPKDNCSYLSWSEVCQLADQGVEFGSHTSNHLALPDIPPARARGELEESLKTLQSYLGPNSFPLSYPHGRTSEGISRLSQSIGYSCAVTTKLGQNDAECDLFALRRTVIASDDDLPTFAARLSGLTFWYSRVFRLFNGEKNGTQESFDDYCEPIVAEEAYSETGVSHLA
jgi:peptidoglycan/xylan/chitin deacetylase (PgdA/CDA1 family)